jgi:hypothetical protein
VSQSHSHQPSEPGQSQCVREHVRRMLLQLNDFSLGPAATAVAGETRTVSAPSSTPHPYDPHPVCAPVIDSAKQYKSLRAQKAW